MGGKARLDARKRRTREHVIADLSINFTQRQVLLAGYTAERFTYDYGLDLFMTTYGPDGSVEPGTVYFQLKATDRIALSADGATARVTVDRADLDQWASEKMPVVLVLYDAVGDRAYWLHVQQFVRTLTGAGETVSVSIPTHDLLTPAAVNGFREWKVQALGRFRAGSV